MKATLYKLRQPDGKEGWVLCSDEEIKEGDKFYHPKGVIFPATPTYLRGPVSSGIMKKALTQSPDLSSLSLDEQKEIGWFDLEKLALAEYPVRICDSYDIICHRVGDDMNEQNRRHFTKGFKKHAELTADRKFTEEDMKKALMSLPTYLNEGLEKHNWIIDKIKSLSQPKSWEVECEEVGVAYKVVKIIKPQLLQ